MTEAAATTTRFPGVVHDNAPRTYDRHASIAAFLDATAARQPIPGGGAVTALTGALAAAVGEMTLNYSIGRKGSEGFEGELKPALVELSAAREALLKAMTEDQSAYAELTLAKKLPETTPDKSAKVQSALMASIRAPQSMAAAAGRMLEVCDRVINFVNPYLLSDLAVCADLAMATTRCAIYNVRVNLPMLIDPAERHQIEIAIGKVLSRSARLIQGVSPRIWERIKQHMG